MRRESLRIAACAMAAVITFSGTGLSAHASESLSSVLPSAGIDYSLAPSEKSTSLSDIKEDVEREASSDLTASTAEISVKGKTEIPIGGMLESNEQTTISDKKIERTIVVSEGYTKDLREASNAARLREEEEGFKSLVIAKVNDYVNVRSIPSEEGEIVGKLYDKSVGTFIEETDGWYKISSGSVDGYVKAEFCVTGDEVVEYAKEVGTRIATVTTTTLFVREQPGQDAPVVGMVPIEDQLIVTEELDGWVKVNIEEGDGYVSTDYVTLSTEFVKAESIEEERARLAKEQAARDAAKEAARKKAAERAASGNSSSESSNGKTYAPPSGNASGQAVVDYALQFVGNPYVYGGTSLTNGADCSGFVMSVYNNFGVSLPHSSSADRSVGATVNGIENAQPGDIICYSGHVGIYVGNGQIVHASTSRTGIIVSNATYRSILSIRRIF
ncbi:MAG: SH3 domain-containing protein [Bacillus sp. (in: Bacteria)]|nr:SH3 domain-containing protein [Bacillus sp. (in: firmicutes)]MCM1427317.1 SH3 domain-containing protein [Eubacterium sp.]